MDKTFIIGNLTADPVARTTPQGVSLCTFTVASNRRAGGEQRTRYWNVTAWRQLGVTCCEYLAKGRRVAVIGEADARAYTGKDGKPHCSLELTADEVEFLSPRELAQAGADLSSYGNVDDSDLPFEQ